jgi:DNA invertase Pin-like site-specific DNA recombinase
VAQVPLAQVELRLGEDGPHRPVDGIRETARALERGDASALVVAKLDRLSRSMLDFAGLMAKAQTQSWALVALDCAVDTTTPAGEAMANVMATFAQFERRLIGQRTKEALAVRRARGVRLGRPPSIAPEVAGRIRAERAAGATLRQIADGLNADAVPTARGGSKWRPSSIEAVVRSGALEEAV